MAHLCQAPPTTKKVPPRWIHAHIILTLNLHFTPNLRWISTQNTRMRTATWRGNGGRKSRGCRISLVDQLTSLLLYLIGCTRFAMIQSSSSLFQYAPCRTLTALSLIYISCWVTANWVRLSPAAEICSKALRYDCLLDHAYIDPPDCGNLLLLQRCDGHGQCFDLDGIEKERGSLTYLVWAGNDGTNTWLSSKYPLSGIKCKEKTRR